MGRESVQLVRHRGMRGGWPGYQPGTSLVAEVQRGDEAVQLPLWAGFPGQRIDVAVPVALARPDLLDVTRVAFRHGFLEGLQVPDDFVLGSDPGFDVQALLGIDLYREVRFGQVIDEILAPVNRRLVREPEAEVDVRLLADSRRAPFVDARDSDIADAFHNAVPRFDACWPVGWAVSLYAQYRRGVGFEGGNLHVKPGFPLKPALECFNRGRA